MSVYKFIYFNAFYVDRFFLADIVLYSHLKLPNHKKHYILTVYNNTPTKKYYGMDYMKDRVYKSVSKDLEL